MAPELVMKISADTLKVTAYVAGPMLAAALIIGLMVSVFQALTQINEATLTFIPKIIIVGVVILLGAPWMLDQLTSFTVNLFENLPEYVRE